MVRLTEDDGDSQQQTCRSTEGLVWADNKNRLSLCEAKFDISSACQLVHRYESLQATSVWVTRSISLMSAKKPARILIWNGRLQCSA